MVTPMDPDKLRSIGFVRAGRIGPQVREGRDSNGRRIKATTDEAGHTVTERADGRVDVTLRPNTIHAGTVLPASTPLVGPRWPGPPCRRCSNDMGDHHGGVCPPPL